MDRSSRNVVRGTDYQVSTSENGNNRFQVFLSSSMVDEIRDIAKDERRPANDVVADLIAAGLVKHEEIKRKIGRLSMLSKREHEVAELVRHGATNRDIANALFISYETAKTHVRSIMRKLDISSRHQLKEIE